jgi:maltose O-acetyltransferase
MQTEKQKMLSGELYNPLDSRLTTERNRARNLFLALNQSRPDHQDERMRILSELLGVMGEGVWIEPPFFCEYGTNIHLGRKVFFNFNCVILDPAPVRIGDNALFGPSVQIYTATHPTDAATRRDGLEFARPVTIGADTWFGGGAIVCPGVTIGARTVIGAGSVVTRDIPNDVLAAGNPCRVIRELPGQPSS